MIRVALRTLATAFVLNLAFGALQTAAQEPNVALAQKNGSEQNIVTASGARIAGDAARTRFVFDLSDSVPMSIFVLSDPYRIIIDLPPLNFAFDQSTNSAGRGLIERWRYGQFSSQTSRLILDLSGPAAVDRSFVLPAQNDQPARLVVDLLKTTPDAFAAVAAVASIRARESNRRIQKSDRLPIGAGRRLRPLIVIDPGHGGVDTGAVGKLNIAEKTIVLDFASVLKHKLEATGEFEVKLTRNEDVFVRLKDRVDFARNLEADLLISVHADSVRQKFVKGASVYTLSDKASDAISEELAEGETRSEILAGLHIVDTEDDVSDILLDLARRETTNFSIHAGRQIVSNLGKAVALVNNPLRSASFRVLRAPDVPSILIELGFLSNGDDEKHLTSPKWRDGAASRIVESLRTFFAARLAKRSNSGQAVE